MELLHNTHNYIEYGDYVTLVGIMGMRLCNISRYNG